MKFLVVCTTDSMIWNFLVPHILFWMEHGHKVEVACSKTGFYFDELKHKFGFEIHEIPFERFPFRKENIKSYRKLKHLIKDKKYDIVISQEPVGGVLGRLAGRKYGCKNVYTAHGFHFYKGAPLIDWIVFYPIERGMAYITDTLITINHEDYMRARQFRARQVIQIDGIGVDINKFIEISKERKDIRSSLKIQDDDYVILTVAELIPRKNYETALKALARLNWKFTYLICGSGKCEHKLRIMAQKLGIQDNVRFLGFRRDVNELYKAADLFLFPSYQEGLSIALIEAMAAGLPIICSSIRGNTDLIKKGKGGLLYKPDDIQGFTDGINMISKNRDNLYGSFNKKYVKKFSVEKSIAYFYNGILL